MSAPSNDGPLPRGPDKMAISAFHEFHMPALANHEARHNVIINIVSRANTMQDQGVLTWTLGGPGCCAAQAPGWPIVLGDLNRSQCRKLAEIVTAMDFSGVVGPDSTAKWFVERAVELGLSFKDPIPQRIYALSEPPTHPAVPGRARQVTAEDADLFADWLTAFHHEAVPDDPVPARELMKNRAVEGRHLFWVVNGEPVSMAGIERRLRKAAAISAVYTPPSRRNRGYAGAVTAALVDRVHAEGKKTACLYTDLRNPFANRCYTKIGFKPVCESWSFARQG